MLVLTRRKDQRIVIGDDVVITVLDVKGDTVRIGIEAPRTVQVHREEVHHALAQANRDAVLAQARSAAPATLPLPPARTAVSRAGVPGTGVPGPAVPRTAVPRPGPMASRPMTAPITPPSITPSPPE